MTYTTNRTYGAGLIPKHGGYRGLKSYQTAEIVYDLTMGFTKRYIKSFKLKEQMDGAARSGKQNIAEGCQISGTSKKTELKLIGVARGSLEELLQDFEDFLRQRELKVWNKTDPRTQTIRQLAYQRDRSNRTYRTYMRGPETAANTLICLINQANYLLDRQLRALEKEFLEKGGFTERLYKKRVAWREGKR